eukprot:scaffold9559_cov101-Isochrysis_galbana.AAC.7
MRRLARVVHPPVDCAPHQPRHNAAGPGPGRLGHSNRHRLRAHRDRICRLGRRLGAVILALAVADQRGAELRVRV